MESSLGAQGLEFKWGKKRGVGGKKKDVQFYESFTFDGVEYYLYDCVLVGNANVPESAYVGKIIKIWEHTNKRAKIPRQVKLLWFFRPSEISPHLEGVPDVLENELFLASGEGLGLANVNHLEAIGGKCSVLCISKDKRNPQPSDEEIKSTDFVFRRAFDVGSRKVLDTIDENIAGVDVKFIFNRAGRGKEAAAVQEIEADVNGDIDVLKPNDPRACGSVREIEDNSVESSECRESSFVCKNEKEKDHNQLAKKIPTFAEERSKKYSGVQEGRAHNEHESCETSGSWGNHCDGSPQESEVKFTKQKSMPADGRYSNSCKASDSKIARVNDVKKQLSQQKSMLAEERYSKESNGLDNRPQKKQKLDGPVTVPYGRNTNVLQNISSDGKTDTGSFKRPRDNVTREEVPPEKPSSVTKQDLGVSVSERKVAKTATEEGLSKKPSGNGKLLPNAEGKLLAADNERTYQVIEVCRRPNAVQSKWFQNLPWEEDMREAEENGTLVLLQNLDPTYTSDEVEDLVYSTLNEKCRARMIERTLVTVHHIGQALVIFKSREAAESAIERLDEGCLLLSKGSPLVADFAKINPPGKPSQFSGHIKLQKTQMRREMKEAVATSHCSQPNNLEFEMALEWCLHQAKAKHAIETIFKRQLEEEKSLWINFKPKLP